MKSFGLTDKGKVRKDNQDSFAAGELPGGVVWAVVCDGMGGAAGGSVASQTAVKMITEKIASGYQHGMSDRSIKNLLTSVVENANSSIYEMSCSVESLNGMGTTVVAAMIRDRELYLVHAGDSRAYRISQEGITQLTRDHSVVQDMVRRGELTYEQAQNHPNKNFITRALGIKPSVRLDYIEANFIYGDVLLICTDGLSNCVTTGDMVKICHENRGEGLITKLVDKAKDGGGSDNITATVIY